MADTLSLISTISFAASVFFLIAGVFFFFFFNIPSVYGDLSGLSAKRALAKRRAENEKSGVAHIYEPAKRNKARGKTTDSITAKDEHSLKQKKKTKRGATEDEKKGLQFVSPDDRPETGLLNLDDPRGKVPGKTPGKAASAPNATEPLTPDTDVLDPGDGSATTELLSNSPPPVSATRRASAMKLTLLDSVVLVHTDEVIN